MSRGDAADLAGRAGTYSLLLALETPTTLDVGALGEVRLAPGGFAYTGSAFGPGGLARVDRHRRVAAGELGTRHWHVDYLLGAARLEDAFVALGADVECAVASSLPGEPVAGFGASDCDCGAHLVAAPDPAPLRDALESRYGDGVLGRPGDTTV